MTAIAEQLEQLAERGPRADPALVVARAMSTAADVELGDTPPPDARRWRPILVGAAAVIVIVGGVAALATDRGRDTATGSPAPPTTSRLDTSLGERVDDPVRLVMQPGTEPFPMSIVWSNEELVRSTSLVSVTAQGEVAHLFLYEVRGDNDAVSRCTAVTGTVMHGSSCSPIESGKPDPVIRTTYVDGDRATVTIEAPAETELVELHFAEHTVEVVPVDGWAVVPTSASEVCPTFTATAHLADGDTVQGSSPTPCFSPPSD